MSKNILVQMADGVLTLVMNRPDKKNALSDEMYGVLADEIEGAQESPDVRVIVIRGEGDAFTAGNDIADFASARPDQGGMRNVTRFIHSLGKSSKPIIAAVQGVAVGVGTTMLLHCDYVVVAEDARLTTPFVSLGLVPEAASSMLLPARIGYLRAFSMLALGEPVHAAEAVSLGLANRVVSNAELIPAIEEVAARFARLPLGAVQATKRLMRDGDELAGRMVTESEIFAQRLTTPEAQEAFMAFAQRRAPDFTKFA